MRDAEDYDIGASDDDEKYIFRRPRSASHPEAPPRRAWALAVDVDTMALFRANVNFRAFDLRDKAGRAPARRTTCERGRYGVVVAKARDAALFCLNPGPQRGLNPGPHRGAFATLEVAPLPARAVDRAPAPRAAAGAALWDTLPADAAHAALRFCDASALGALGCAHRDLAELADFAAAEQLRQWAHVLRRRSGEPQWRTLRAAANWYGGGLESGGRIAAGGAHTLLVDVDGALFACGRGTCGALGLGGAYDVDLPARVALPVRVACVAAGAHHSLAIDEQGQLYAWGKAGDGRLGLGPAVAADALAVDTPRRVDTVCMKRCAAGLSHSLAVDADGGAWAWGRGAHGQLGHGAARSVAAPKRIAALTARPCRGVSAGSFHSLACGVDGALYAFGLGAEGRLGLGHAQSAPLPERVLLPAGLATAVRQCSAGAAHSACVTDAGDVYTWGDATRGALGHSRPGTLEAAPRRVAALESVRVLCALATELETVALDDDGNVWTLRAKAKASSPKSGCATGQGAPSAVTKKVNGTAAKAPAVVAIAASALHMVSLDADEVAYAWGDVPAARGAETGARPRHKPALLQKLQRPHAAH